MAPTDVLLWSSGLARDTGCSLEVRLHVVEGSQVSGPSGYVAHVDAMPTSTGNTQLLLFDTGLFPGGEVAG